MNSNSWFKKNGLTVFVIIGCILFFPIIKELLEAIMKIFKGEEETQEEDVDNANDVLESEVNISNLEIEPGECYSIAQSIRNELALTNFSTEWVGNFDIIGRMLCKNSDELNNDFYHHFYPDGKIRSSGNYTFSDGIWDETVYIKKFIPYNKDTLKLIFAKFGTPTFDYGTNGEPSVLSPITQYVTGQEDDWNLQKWLDHRLTVGQYKIAKTIFKSTNLL